MGLAPLRFTTTASRIAYTFVANDVGRLVKDLENGHIYMVISSGAGVDKMVNQSGHTLVIKGISLRDFREVDANGDVGAIAAACGVLGSDTTPILRAAATTESEEISWATGNVDPISVQLSLSSDELDDTRDVTLELDVYSGTTDAATFTVETTWNAGTIVADSASDAATKSATAHTITATIAAADIPTSVRRVTIALTPTNAHASNAYQLVGARLKYYRV
jgi:hypothetical protein